MSAGRILLMIFGGLVILILMGRRLRLFRL